VAEALPVRLEGAETTPEQVISTWKSEFGRFWPKGNSFYGPITGIAPGEVALLNLAAPGGQTLSTGVLVIYADDESFTFMTPKGTCSQPGSPSAPSSTTSRLFVQIEVLLRANDPLYEVSMAFFGHRQENAFWMATLHNLAARFERRRDGHARADLRRPEAPVEEREDIRHNAGDPLGGLDGDAPAALVPSHQRDVTAAHDLLSSCGAIPADGARCVHEG